MEFIINYLIFNVLNLINVCQISSMFFFKNEKIQYLTNMFLENFYHFLIIWFVGL